MSYWHKKTSFTREFYKESLQFNFIDSVVAATISQYCIETMQYPKAIYFVVDRRGHTIDFILSSLVPHYILCRAEDNRKKNMGSY